jgi:hypothetical protein
MIEISISRELADAHPGFMAGCADRGYQVQLTADEIAAGDTKPPAGRLSQTNRHPDADRHLAGGRPAGRREDAARGAAGSGPRRR